jgi:hypothetical protein
MAIDENDPRLKDMLRAIELGELPEDLNDPEDYDDMGGIKSLDKGAPSIKMASETGAEEFELELGTVIAEYNDLKSKGDPAVRNISLEQYIENYFSKKKMMEENRAMVMGGGMMRMNYAGGTPEKMGNPAVVTEIENMREERIMNPDVEDVTDYKRKYERLKKQDEEIKRMLNKAKKEKVKRAKGGIAGVL